MPKSDARKNRILDTAESLFIEKGYGHTTIDDMLQASGIAKGSLYYYYKSKEDVLDGIIMRRGDMYIEAAGAIAGDARSGPHEKLLRVMFTLRPEGERQKKLIDDLEKAANGHMFLKSLTDIILRLAPVLRGIIEQGASDGAFATRHPLECAEILLSAAHSMFDNADLKWTPEEQARKIAAFVCVAERMLGAAEGSLLEAAQPFMPSEYE